MTLDDHFKNNNLAISLSRTTCQFEDGRYCVGGGGREKEKQNDGGKEHGFVAMRPLRVTHTS